MKTVYKTKPHRILLNVLYGLGTAFIIAVIAEFVLKSTLLAALVFIAVLALYIWLVIMGNIMCIEIDDQSVTVKQGKKSTVFNRNEISVRAEIKKTVPRGGGIPINTSRFLYIAKQGDNEHRIDCELLGGSQFEAIIEQLGIGESVSTVEATKKE